MKFRQYLVQQPATTAKIDLERQIAQRFQPQHVVQEELVRARRILFPLARAPIVGWSKSPGQPLGRGLALQQPLRRAERISLRAVVDNSQPRVDRISRRERIARLKNARQQPPLIYIP